MSISHPNHWHGYTGPSNWYRVWHPSGWVPAEGETSVRLAAPNDQGVLILSCGWSAKERKGVDAEQLARSTIQAKELHNVRRGQPLDFAYRSVCLEGEIELPKPGGWLKRLFSRRARRRWRVWVVHHKSLCLIAQYHHSGAADPELETMAAMILRTLEFAEEPADPPQIFADRVLSLARSRFPLLECKSVDDFRLQLGESSVNLFNFYRSYVNEPTRFEEIVLPALTTVVQVQEWGTDQTEPPLENVRSRILPMLYPEAVWKQSFPNFVAAPWIADLMILYVVDETQSYWYIRDELLTKWGLDCDELHSLAIENLENYFEQHEMTFTLAGDDDGPRLLVPNRPDAYNSARLLSPAFHRKLREHLGSPLAIGIPGRDFLVGVSLDSPEALEQVRRQIAEDHARMDHPLTSRLLLISPDGVSEYCEY